MRTIFCQKYSLPHKYFPRRVLVPRWEVSKFSISSRKSILTFLGQNPKTSPCANVLRPPPGSPLSICIGWHRNASTEHFWGSLEGILQPLFQPKRRKNQERTPRISLGAEIPVGSAVVSRQPNLSSEEEDVQAVASAPSPEKGRGFIGGNYSL